MDVNMKFALLFLLLSTTGWAKWSVSTYNIRNFDSDSDGRRTDLVELGRILKESQSDVMAFPEIVNKSAFDTLVKSNLSGYEHKISNCGGFGRQHLAVAYNTKVFEYVKHAEDLSFSGTSGKCGSLRPVFLVTLKNKTTNQIYTFGAVHLKAGGSNRAMEQRWQQYSKLEGLTEKYKNENLVLLGDFNTTGYNIKDRDYQKFEDLLGSSSLRTTSESIACSSYWRGTQGGSDYQPSILDHVVVQDKTFANVESVKVGSHCGRLDCRPATPEELGTSYQSVSDHCPIQVTFK